MACRSGGWKRGFEVIAPWGRGRAWFYELCCGALWECMVSYSTKVVCAVSQKGQGGLGGGQVSIGPVWSGGAEVRFLGIVWVMDIWWVLGW